MVLARESENETKKRKKGTCRQKHCSTEIMNIQETILLVYFFEIREAINTSYMSVAI